MRRPALLVAADTHCGSPGARPGGWLAAIVAAGLAAALAGCDAEGGLSGSLSDVYRLDHEVVRARLYTSELAIEYARNDGSVPVRVTLRRRDQEPGRGTFDLGEVGAVTGQLSDGTNIPPFLDGKLELDAFVAQPGADISGSFEATFGAERDTLALSGDFDTTLELIEWPLSPDAGVFDGGAP